MKKLIPMMAAAVCAAAAFGAIDVKHPAFKMTEAELLEVVAGGDLNAKVTACQELGHAGTAKAVPALAALLADGTDRALFLAACNGLLNIPGAEADAALAAAAGKLSAERAGTVKYVQGIRAQRKPAGYDAAAAVKKPAYSVWKDGKIPSTEELVATALGGGFNGTLAHRYLVGGKGNAAELLALAGGADAAKAKVAVAALGDKRERSALPVLKGIIESGTAPRGLKNEAAKALATLCDGKRDMALLIGLVKAQPGIDRLAGAIIRVASREFTAKDAKIAIVKAEFGNFEAKKTKDVKKVVEALVRAGSRSIMSGTRLSGNGGFPHDPAPNMKKELRITYTLDGGAEIASAVPENKELDLLPLELPAEVAGPLLKAQAEATGEARAALDKAVETLRKRAKF